MQSRSWVLWNLSLAAAPVALGWLIAWAIRTYTMRPRGVSWIVWVPLLALWLALLPNSCYLVTERRHLLFGAYYAVMRGPEAGRAEHMTAVLWDAYFFLYAGFGVVCFALAVRPIDRLVSNRWLKRLILAPMLFSIVAFGVYLGLVHRFNSWDLLTRPAHVADVISAALHSRRLLELLAAFAAGLWILYLIVDVWVDGLAMRLGRAVRPQPARARKK